MGVPKCEDLFNPLLQAMHNLGGSAAISEQEDEVSAILKLSEEDISDIQYRNITKFSYRLGWARTYLKKDGLLNNSERGVWALTTEGQKLKEINKIELRKRVSQAVKLLKDNKTTIEEIDESEDIDWKDKLLEIIKSMPPDAFERLSQRLLRESGFIHVEVTGKIGDGGIDGKGVVRLGGLISFHMMFQCKRWQGSVPSKEIRDFRGSMQGRADKGLFITTGTFTKEARLEAQRDGAPPIDLVDGNVLVEKLKELKIGIEVKEKVIEDVLIDEEFFKGI